MADGPAARGRGPLIGLGGAATAASALLFFLNLVMTITASPRRAVAAPPFAEYLHGPESTPAFFDRLGPWLAITVALILIAYLPPFVAFLASPAPGAPGARPW